MRFKMADSNIKTEFVLNKDQSSNLDQNSGLFRNLQMIQVGRNKTSADVERFAFYITKIKPIKMSLLLDQTDAWLAEFDRDLG